MSTLGNRIKASRIEKKISQTELGNHIGVGKTTISNYETGYSSPDPDTLAKIADFLEVTSDFLLGLSNTKSSTTEDKEAPFLPRSFSTPEEAVKFLLEQNVIMGFGGFDINKLTDKEIIDFANELLSQLQLLSYKYKKQE